jgi:hypothetical protein
MRNLLPVRRNLLLHYASSIIGHWNRRVKLCLGIHAPVLIRMGRMGWDASWKGRESNRSSASVPAYLTVVGRPALGLASLTRHDETKPVGGRIHSGEAEMLGRDRRKNTEAWEIQSLTAKGE